MTKKVGFSLKAKIILLVCTLLLGALGTYAWFAISLFREDKTAYVYEASLNGLQQLEQKMKATVQEQNAHLSLLNRVSSQSQTQDLKRYLDENPYILAYAKLSTHIDDHRSLSQSFLVSFTSKQFSKYSPVDKNEWEEFLFQKIQVHLQSPPIKKHHLINPMALELESMGAHMITLQVDPSDPDALTLILSDLNQLSESFAQQRVFDFVIRDKNGTLFPLVNLQRRDKEEFKALFDKIKTTAPSGLQSVKEVKTQNNSSFLVAHHQLSHSGIEIMSVIAKDQAFAAANYLVKQSFIIAIIILSMTVMIGIVFSQSLTRQLEKLYLATLKIAQGDFESKVEVRGSDEISALGHSFNFMAQKILVYIQEMKEKNRLENELAVAKLVQDSFFPPNKIQVRNLSMASFYTPATECGGDWWGYLETKDKTILIIADATGHGVPAAFLTATVHSCVQTLEQVSKTHPEVLSSPEKILSFMNETVLRVGKDILLTGFVMIFDQKSGEVSYSNASHLDPLVLRPTQNTAPTKQDLIPLMEGKGPRLGHEKSPHFTSSSFQLKKGDVFILWTDGLTEAENPEGKQWGQRNFLKAFLASDLREVESIREGIINQLITFNQEHPFEDDVTLICGRWEGV